jgi:alkylation response protein AidB-like acyl-CoA dehydrogenase
MLLCKVEQIMRVLRDNAQLSEMQRSLAEPSVNALRVSGLFAAFAPTEVGGYQADPLTEMELVEAVSAIDGSTGWSFMAGAGNSARVASVLPEEALAEVFPPGGPFPVFAFQVLAGEGIVERVTGGVVVTGRWPYGTGVAHSDWVLAVGRLLADPGETYIATVVPIEQVKIIDTWDALGLTGTGTFDYAFEKVFVPTHRTWNYPSAQPLRAHAYFCFKRAPIKHLGFALGVARHSLQLLTNRIAKRAMRKASPLSDIGEVLKGDLGRAFTELGAARALGRKVIGDVWEAALRSGQVDSLLQHQLRAAASYATETAIRVCNLVVLYGGAGSLRRYDILQRNLRDILAGAQHLEVANDSFGAVGYDLLVNHSETNSPDEPEHQTTYDQQRNFSSTE